MDFVTHLLWIPRRHDVVWVMVDRLTKSVHFLAVQMTFTLEEFCRLYIQDIVRLHGVQVSIVSNTLLEELPKGYGDAVDDEHRLSPIDRWSVGEDHTDFRGHAASMRPES